MERSGALELSRDDDCANCLLEFEFTGCLLCVLLDRDDESFLSYGYSRSQSSIGRAKRMT